MEPAGAACALCGLPAGPRPTRALLAGVPRSFCCPGCRHVFEMLLGLPGGPPADPRDNDLFRAGVATGLLPGPGAAPPAAAAPGAGADGAAAKATFRVEGMWCPSCAWWIEEALRRTDGVVEARVSFAADLATVRHLPHRTDLPRLLDRVAALGYAASRLDDPTDQGRRRRAEAVRLGVSLILTAHLMMISMALSAGFFADLGRAGTLCLSWPQWLLATPVVFYGGLPILRRAGLALRARAATMDSLLAAGSLSAYAYSLVALAAGSLHLYFDTAAALVSLALLGRAVEGRARERLTAPEADLRGRAGGKARLRAGGGERWVPAAAVAPGDELVVEPGEAVPADGLVVEGSGRLDESALTGEARPVARGPGDEVAGGALLVDGRLRLRALRPTAESAAGRLVALAEEALARRSPAEHLADRLTRRLVPAVLGLAAAAAAWLLLRGAPAGVALGRALAVVVITCPCALGLATPLAKVAALGAGRRRGILVRDPGALERIPSLTALVLDKTGTVTEGRFELREVAVRGAAEEDALRRAASLELRSGHPLAAALRRRAEALSLALEEPGEAEEVPGRGVRGVVRGEATAVGSRPFLEGLGLAVPEELDRRRADLEAAGLTAVLAGWSGQARALFAFGDALRPGAAAAVETLRSRGLSLWLLSGDSPGATAAVARRLGIGRAVGGAAPADKARLVRELKAQGHRVGVAGDGVNDAAALAEADVGFAVGAGDAFLRRSADVVIPAADPRRLAAAFDHAALASRVIRRNLAFAFLYNALAIPAALAGLLNPIFAALAMVGSSMTVVASTLALLRPEGTPDPDPRTREEGRFRPSSGPA